MQAKTIEKEPVLRKPFNKANFFLPRTIIFHLVRQETFKAIFSGDDIIIITSYNSGVIEIPILQ